MAPSPPTVSLSHWALPAVAFLPLTHDDLVPPWGLCSIITSFSWNFLCLVPDHSVSQLRWHFLREVFLDHRPPPPVLCLHITLFFVHKAWHFQIFVVVVCFFVILSSAFVCADRDLVFWFTAISQSQDEFQGHRGCLVKSLWGIFSNNTFVLDFKSQRDNHMEYVDNCMVLHGASADQDSETGSWCGLWLAHCAVARASFRRSAFWFPQLYTRGTSPSSAQSLCTDEWCRDIMGYECETMTLQPVKIFQKPEDTVEGTQRRECSREKRLLQTLNSLTGQPWGLV